MANFKQILEAAHRKVVKDTDYPEEDDLLVRVDYLCDAITEWENKVKEGIYWPELLVPDFSISFGGTGTDELPENFLSFFRSEDEDSEPLPALIVSGSYRWTEISAKEGVRLAQEGASPYVFWRQGRNIRTLPAASGSIPVTYMKKATRPVTGEEETEPELDDHKFLEDYVTARIFLDNDDDTLYATYANSASEKLNQMTYDHLSSVPKDF